MALCAVTAEVGFGGRARFYKIEMAIAAPLVQRLNH